MSLLLEDRLDEFWCEAVLWQWVEGEGFFLTNFCCLILHYKLYVCNDSTTDVLSSPLVASFILKCQSSSVNSVFKSLNNFRSHISTDQNKFEVRLSK